MFIDSIYLTVLCLTTFLKCSGSPRHAPGSPTRRVVDDAQPATTPNANALTLTPHSPSTPALTSSPKQTEATAANGAVETWQVFDKTVMRTATGGGSLSADNTLQDALHGTATAPSVVQVASQVAEVRKDLATDFDCRVELPGSSCGSSSRGTWQSNGSENLDSSHGGDSLNHSAHMGSSARNLSAAELIPAPLASGDSPPPHFVPVVLQPHGPATSENALERFPSQSLGNGTSTAHFGAAQSVNALAAQPVNANGTIMKAAGSPVRQRHAAGQGDSPTGSELSGWLSPASSVKSGLAYTDNGGGSGSLDRLPSVAEPMGGLSTVTSTSPTNPTIWADNAMFKGMGNTRKPEDDVTPIWVGNSAAMFQEPSDVVPDDSFREYSEDGQDRNSRCVFDLSSCSSTPCVNPEPRDEPYQLNNTQPTQFESEQPVVAARGLGDTRTPDEGFASMHTTYMSTMDVDANIATGMSTIGDITSIIDNAVGGWADTSKSSPTGVLPALSEQWPVTRAAAAPVIMSWPDHEEDFSSGSGAFAAEALR